MNLTHFYQKKVMIYYCNIVIFLARKRFIVFFFPCLVVHFDSHVTNTEYSSYGTLHIEILLKLILVYK